jgi:hypothetical protein
LIASRNDIRWLIVRRTKPTFCVFPLFSVAVMERGCDACFHGDCCFWSGFSAPEAASVSVASTVVDRKSMGHTVADRSSNEADFVCILLCLAWRLWRSVVKLAVKRDTICGRVFRRQGVPEFKRPREPLTGSRWDKRWLIGPRTKPTFCVFCCI